MRSWRGLSCRKLIRAFEIQREAAVAGRAVDLDGNDEPKGVLPRSLADIDSDLALWRARLAEPAPMHAQADGKARVAASVVWWLTVGGFRLRCLPNADRYEIQVRLTTGWEGLCYGTDPLELLQRAASAGAVARNIKLLVPP